MRSVLWDLGIPQCSATVLYEDNNAATSMANAQKPTPRTRHMDVKYRVLAEWVERDLVTLERVDTTLNWADHFTKQLGPLLFNRHIDYILGHVPPTYSSRFKDVYETLKRKVPIATTSPNIKRPLTAAAAKLTAAWNAVNQYYRAIL